MYQTIRTRIEEGEAEFLSLKLRLKGPTVPRCTGDKTHTAQVHRAYIAYMRAEIIDIPKDTLESTAMCPAAAVLVDDEVAAAVREPDTGAVVVAASGCVGFEFEPVV